MSKITLQSDRRGIAERDYMAAGIMGHPGHYRKVLPVIVPGAGRKRKCENPVMIAAQVPAKIRDKLDRFAQANDLSRSAALVEAIRRLKL